jgi:hypothetical protein
MERLTSGADGRLLVKAGSEKDDESPKGLASALPCAFGLESLRVDVDRA